MHKASSNPIDLSVYIEHVLLPFSGHIVGIVLALYWKPTCPVKRSDGFTSNHVHTDALFGQT